jgi:hypothetical protein
MMMDRRLADPKKFASFGSPQPTGAPDAAVMCRPCQPAGTDATVRTGRENVAFWETQGDFE